MQTAMCTEFDRWIDPFLYVCMSVCTILNNHKKKSFFYVFFFFIIMKAWKEKGEKIDDVRESEREIDSNFSIPSHFRTILSSGLMVFVLNSMWCPVNERKSNAAATCCSRAITSNVSQQKRMSADSFPVLNFDLSSSIIDFDDQMVGDVWSMATTWSENKSLRNIMSPLSSRKNLMPHKPRSSEFKSSDSVICKINYRIFKKIFN